ncbi:hypothetical protein P7C70_g5244, partial [Phenoliferia sp. Uapishka_3]
MRSPSPASMISCASTAPSAPLSLLGTDPAVFRACLEQFYSGSEGGVTVLFEGFEEGVREGEMELKGVDKLRSDCLFMWRSRLYGDMTIALEDTQGSIFSVHKAILASRSPYFRSLLLGNYADSNQTHFTLPSPPFTSASMLFVLGYIYSGTLNFGNRSFDLTTAFEIWRGGSYLQLALLQEDIEDRIEKMLNLQRAPRIYSFALGPEVGSLRLARAAHPFVVDRFSETWSCKEIGNLEYTSQKKLVSAVCAKITSTALTAIAKGSFVLRKRLELEKAAWAGHVRAMLDAIDERLKAQIGKSLTEVVASTGFIELVDGIGFSSDVLEFVLEMAVGSLTEAKAPEAYQSLVGSVLLREEGILMDARVLVEDAKTGIIKYIKRKSNAIKLAKGFDGLESWALKELSDELEVSPGDLISPPNSRSTTRSTPRRLAAAAAVTTPRQSTLSSAATPRQSTATSATTSTATPRQPTLAASTSTLPPTVAPMPTPRSALSASEGSTTRVPRLSTTSTAPRVVARSNASTLSAANGRGGALSARGGRGALRGTSAVVRGTRTDLSSSTTSTGSTSRTSPSSAPTTAPSSPSTSIAAALADSIVEPPVVTGSSPPRPSRPPPSPPATQTATPISHQPSAPTLKPPPVGKQAALGSSTNGSSAIASTSASASARPPRQSSSMTRRPSSLAPSVASERERSTSSLSNSKTRPRPKTPTTPKTPTATRPAPPRIATTSQSTPGSLKGKETALNTPIARPPRKLSTAASTKTVADGLKRPASAASIRSVASVRAPAAPSPAIKRPASATSMKAATPKPATKPPVTLRRPSVASPAKSPPPPKPPLPTTSSGLPGTTLLSGIPCIVTVAADRPTRFRATVRYIGQVLWTDGQWIGIEVAESSVPDEARDLDWNDGTVAGQQYFDIKPPSAKNLAVGGRATPQPSSESLDGHSAGSSSLSNGSLRPPSRRGGRRSSSSDGGEQGPRRGLFVRPNQIVYVL